MNITRIILSGLITGVVGIVLGIGLAEINQDDNRPQAPYQYAVVGAILGLAVGSGQEAIRQLDQTSEDFYQ
ncbi:MULTISPECIES: hypothetical protein [unclassified Coleofasciculus]|uniref:hypothetical protein n=1 Tax=unclassified Coleofasciculus TaxID=2692782 RepID=UPI001881AFDF|nr:MULTISPECIES: hypothetical protein [unclassified Coleofasciculus]MBE9127648.1 hypothetical protein [Coleofasciculus sp. LEGE 07081]MBE9150967.1 hypothetical protein [Coleofasciculus sp. LEGE 07092]